MTRVNGCCTIKAMAPTSPPNASDPVSPMKTSAGAELYQRNARHAPNKDVHIIVNSPAPSTCSIRRVSDKTKFQAIYAITPYANATVTVQPVANPSKPSVRFMALLDPTRTKNNRIPIPHIGAEPIKTCL